MLGNCSAVSDIAKHHGILHRPRIVAIHKSDETVVAICTPGSMVGIDRLALYEKGIMCRNDGTRLRFRISELE